MAIRPTPRFARLAIEPQATDDPEASGPAHPRTQYLVDASRTIVARNTSPDVGFDASINPYRGCEHGCSYCLSPETPVLRADMSWGPIGELRVGDELVGFDERPGPGRTRKLRRARVEAMHWSRRPTRRLVTEHTEVLTTEDHLWLQARDHRWSRTDRLAPGRELRHMPVQPAEPLDPEYRHGYIAAMTLGDGTYRYEPGQRSDELGYPQTYWRIALIDRGPLERLQEFLRYLGVDVPIRRFDPAPACRSAMWKVETRALSELALIDGLLRREVASRSYRRGFLAGFFDAEGHDGTSRRMSRKDISVLERVRDLARCVGFELSVERRSGQGTPSLRLVGSLAERIRFFSVCRPALDRKRSALFGRQLSIDPERIEAVEPGPTMDVVDIQTSTRTFHAGGLATHNCYARPTHEYLDLSAGLDFETRILVKRDAAALLRRALASRSWRPRVVALSGVTDAFQPVERRLRITRACLEVLAEFRNPVSIITKSAGVTRDLDLLRALAEHDAVSVAISVTTLDPELARRLEPRAAQPRARLAAIRALAGAGIPVGVMVAPVIPGLTDEEMPRILEAAAGAGAGWAGRVMLRLPHGVDEIFEDWLRTHRPERRERVMRRVREVGGDRTYDARFGVRQRGSGTYAEQLGRLFELARRRAGLAETGPELSTAHFRRPDDPDRRQLALFE